MNAFDYNDSSDLLEIPRRLAREAQTSNSQPKMPEIPNEPVIKCNVWYPGNVAGRVLLTFKSGYILYFEFVDGAELVMDRTPFSPVLVTLAEATNDAT